MEKERWEPVEQEKKHLDHPVDLEEMDSDSEPVEDELPVDKNSVPTIEEFLEMLEQDCARRKEETDRLREANRLFDLYGPMATLLEKKGSGLYGWQHLLNGDVLVAIGIRSPPWTEQGKKDV
mmetsp:Transcript_8723/g.24963  ORF Transcript_8723/g.24963 Transcript_8723/m.24963 type:complete len:122 (+) Transcript_8723:791-1156(+)